MKTTQCLLDSVCPMESIKKCVGRNAFEYEIKPLLRRKERI
jgi:hypothetical protein